MRFFRIPSFTGIEAHRDDADRGSLRMVEGCLPHGPGGLRSGPVWKKIGDVSKYSTNDSNHVTAADDGQGNSALFVSRNCEIHDLAVISSENTNIESFGESYDVAIPEVSLYNAGPANLTPIGNKLYAVGDGSQEAMFVGKGPDDTFEVFPDENLYSQEWSRFPRCQFFVQGPKKTIFAAGNPEKPLTIYISEPAGLTSPYRDTPYSTEDTTYNQGVLSTVNILGSNASKITALSTRGDQVVVHTDKGCHLLYAPAPDQANTGYRVEQAPATNFSAAVNSKVVSRASGALTYWIGHDGQVYKDEAASRGSEDLRSRADEDQANWKSKGVWEHELPTDLTGSFAAYSPQSGDYLFFVKDDNYYQKVKTPTGFEVSIDPTQSWICRSPWCENLYELQGCDCAVSSNGTLTYSACLKSRPESCWDQYSIDGDGCCEKVNQGEYDSLAECIASGGVECEDLYELQGCDCIQSSNGTLTYSACIGSRPDDCEDLYELQGCDCIQSSNGTLTYSACIGSRPDDCEDLYELQGCDCIQSSSGTLTYSACIGSRPESCWNEWSKSSNNCCEKVNQGEYGSLAECIASGGVESNTVSYCSWQGGEFTWDKCADPDQPANFWYEKGLEPCPPPPGSAHFIIQSDCACVDTGVDLRLDGYFESMEACEADLQNNAECGTYDLVDCECVNAGSTGAFTSVEDCETEKQNTCYYTLSECDCVQDSSGTLLYDACMDSRPPECWDTYTLTENNCCELAANGEFSTIEDCTSAGGAEEILADYCKTTGGVGTLNLCGLENLPADFESFCPAEGCACRDLYYDKVDCNCVSELRYDQGTGYASQQECDNAILADNTCVDWHVIDENCQCVATETEGEFTSREACDQAVLTECQNYARTSSGTGCDCELTRFATLTLGECRTQVNDDPNCPTTTYCNCANYGASGAECTCCDYDIEGSYYGDACVQNCPGTNYCTTAGTIGNTGWCGGSPEIEPDFYSYCPTITLEDGTQTVSCNDCPKNVYVASVENCECNEEFRTPDESSFTSLSACENWLLNNSDCGKYEVAGDNCECVGPMLGGSYTLDECLDQLNSIEGCEPYMVNDNCECVQDANGTYRSYEACSNAVLDGTEPQCATHYIEDCNCTTSPTDLSTEPYIGLSACLTALDGMLSCFCNDTDNNYSSFQDGDDLFCNQNPNGTLTECDCITIGATIIN